MHSCKEFPLTLNHNYRWKYSYSAIGGSAFGGEELGVYDSADPVNGVKLVGQIKALSEELSVSPILAQILVQRGINSKEKARIFFKPNIEDLHDPFLMDGMELAISRILHAIRSQEQITVYGDYDVDGTNGTALLWTFLRKLGAQVKYYIPDRLNEGYGLSNVGLDRAKSSGTSLLLTVDCGITAVDQVEYARSIDLDVIICDHHEPGEIIPAAHAVLDPLKPSCKYPFKYLCGCGVAFKLIQALATQEYVSAEGGLGGDALEHVASYLDLVALATTADIVPLVGENRTLVKLGLELMNAQPRPGIQALIESAGLRLGKINSGNIVFGLAPRINAVGRLGNAERAVALLTCESYAEAVELAKVFEQENRNRRKIDEDTFAEALELVESAKGGDIEKDTAIVLHNDQWHPGVIGIVASRLVERFYRPTVLMTTIDGVAKGSARSISGFDIYQALRKCEDKILQFGGHKYAAGLSVEIDKLTEFKQAFSAVTDDLLDEHLLTPEIVIEAEVDLADLTPKFIHLLNQFAPFGPQNPRPVFAVRNIEVLGTPRIVGTNHLKFKVKQGTRVIDAIGFNLGGLIDRIHSTKGATVENRVDPVNGVDLAFSIDENEFAGTTLPQLKIKDLKPPATVQPRLRLSKM